MSKSESESDSESEIDSVTAAMEALSVFMEKRDLKGIVALTGLPSTCKTELALSIGSWAKCPVLCIQDFLGEGAGKTGVFNGATAEADFSPPTGTEQVERHYRKAFGCLLAVALRHLDEGGWHCVVIKSSLNTPYELQQLQQLARYVYNCRLIIMECKIRNKYLWKGRFERLIEDLEEARSWCRPRSWKDIDKALDDDDDDCAAHHPPTSVLTLHLYQRNIVANDCIFVAWMGVDPIYDLSLGIYTGGSSPLPDEFNDAIKYLLTVPNQMLPENPYVVEYDELRRFLFYKKLIRAVARKGRSESFCEGDCVFRYCLVPEEEDCEADFCGVCQCQISRQPTYTCHFCVTSLHKTCAERFPTWVLQHTRKDLFLYCSPCISEQLPCKACQGGGKQFSKECRSCILQDRLKCHRFPTILYHNSHPHFLSIQLFHKDYRCKACGIATLAFIYTSYGCKMCAFYCHIPCALLPLELKQVHGGHDHVMKLMYTRDAMEEEEDPIWCDYCYEDMDPELWFYACQECPHYVVHLHCSGGFHLPLKDPKMVKFVEQLQSQLDDCVCI